jgi:hypothetical protein
LGGCKPNQAQHGQHQGCGFGHENSSSLAMNVPAANFT